MKKSLSHVLAAATATRTAARAHEKNIEESAGAPVCQHLCHGGRCAQSGQRPARPRRLGGACLLSAEPSGDSRKNGLFDGADDLLVAARAALVASLQRNDGDAQSQLADVARSDHAIMFKWRSILPLFVRAACDVDERFCTTNHRLIGGWLTQRCRAAQFQELSHSRSKGTLRLAARDEATSEISLAVPEGERCMLCGVVQSAFPDVHLLLCLPSAADGRCNGCARFVRNFADSHGAAYIEAFGEGNPSTSRVRTSWAVSALRAHALAQGWQARYNADLDATTCWVCLTPATSHVRKFADQSSPVDVPVCAECRPIVRKAATGDASILNDCRDDIGLLGVGAIVKARQVVMKAVAEYYKASSLPQCIVCATRGTETSKEIFGGLIVAMCGSDECSRTLSVTSLARRLASSS